MKHYQKIGKIAHGTHPKDANIVVDDKGIITEIIEGVFIDEPKPELQASINQQAQVAKKRWMAARKALDERPRLPVRSDRVRRTEVQLGGFGGQGIVSAGRIIGQAATIYDKLQATFTQSYGPEARGGAAGSQVIIDSDAIHHPHLIEPTSAVIMSQEAYTKYVPRLAEGGTLCIDDGLVILPEDHRRDLKTCGIEATRIAEELGNVRAANTVMLGLWTAIIEAVSKAAMRQSLADAVPPKTLEVNTKAFDVGFEEGKRLKAANGVKVD
jgi:2-oxoglutarate ferredoxin oxidoreductase subunit gamma